MIDIIKQSPNILPWEFVEKAEELGVKPKLGELPKEFVSEEVFNELLTAIRTHNEEVMRKNPNETIEKALLGQEYTVKTSAGNYKIVTATTGERPKNVLLITPENDGENSFVLKYIPADSGKKINYTLSNNLVPDLPYINAMIDFYLKENKCKNSPDIRYFDFDKQIVIYTNRGGEKTDYNADLGNLFLFSKNKKVSDIKDLGVIFNDFHNGNFLELSDGTFEFIDSGHVRYSSLFRPPVIGKHMSLGNLCGREYLEI